MKRNVMQYNMCIPTTHNNSLNIMFENKQQEQTTNCDLTVQLNNNKNNKEQLCNIFRLKVTYRTNQYIIKT